MLRWTEAGRRHRLPVLLAALLTLAWSGESAAQSFPSGSIQGRIVDAATGAPVPDATLRVAGEATERTVVADAGGRWRVAGLASGRYRLTASRLGYGEGRLSVQLPAASGEEVLIALAPAAQPLEALVVTASRRVQRLADVPVTTEVVTRRDIEIAGVADLSTLLTQRLGIQVEGGHPAGEGLMLQGLGSERVLVLLDGQPLVGRLSGTLDISRLPTSLVERIEVVKGSQSSLYGSEAMGGVVNIITRRSTTGPWSFGVEGTTGSQGRMDLSGSLNGTLGSVDYLVDAGRRATEVTPGMESTRGALSERRDGLLKLGWSPLERLRLEAAGILLDERQRWQGGQLYQFADNVQRGARLGAEWTAGAHRLSPTLHWTEFEHLSRRAAMPAPADGTGERELQRLYEAELLYYVAAGELALDAGVEARREEIGSDRVAGHDRTLHSLEPFAQATLPLGSLRLVPGARLSWSEQWGAHFTPRLAAMLRPAGSLALRASLGQGYRAPGFKELYMEFLNVGPGFGYVVKGNSRLQPETSTNLTTGVEWSLGSGFLRAQLFGTRFDDFIETVLAGDSSGVMVYSYDNVSEGWTRGLEIEGGLARRTSRLEAGYSYLQSRAAERGEPLLGRPAHSARASLEHALPLGTRGALTSLYTGPTPVQRTEEEGVREREGYLRFDANLTGELPAGLRLSAGVRNLFDARPADWPGFTGRHLFIGLGWRAAAADAPDPHPAQH